MVLVYIYLNGNIMVWVSIHPSNSELGSAPPPWPAAASPAPLSSPFSGRLGHKVGVVWILGGALHIVVVTAVAIPGYTELKCVSVTPEKFCAREVRFGKPTKDTVRFITLNQFCGSNYIEFGSGSRILANFGSGARVMYSICNQFWNKKNKNNFRE